MAIGNNFQYDNYPFASDFISPLPWVACPCGIITNLEMSLLLLFYKRMGDRKKVTIEEAFRYLFIIMSQLRQVINPLRLMPKQS